MKNRLTTPFSLVLFLLIVFNPTLTANEMQVNLMMAGVNLGWAVGAIELGGITPASQDVIAGYLTDAIGFITNAEGFLFGPYADLGLIDLNPDLERFWTHTASWNLQQRAVYIANVYNRLRLKVSYIFNSQRRLIQRANCDTAYVDVGYHFGRANMGAFFGDESYRVSAHGSMTRAVNNGLAAARDLMCEFATSAEWEALPLTPPYTAASYTAALEPLIDIASTMAADPPPPPPPPPPSDLPLIGSWRMGNGCVLEFRASGDSIAGILAQAPDWQIRMGFSQGEQIYTLTDISGTTYSGQAKIRDQSGNVYWGRITITVSGNSYREEIVMPNGDTASGTGTRIVR